MLVQNNGDAPDATPPLHQNSGALAHCAALLLSGGDGKRLQELTSEVTGSPIPKQYCRLLHGSSLLEAAVARAKLLLPPERIHVVINENHLDLARDHIQALPAANVFVQPLNRDTGPGITFALLTLERAYGDATVAVFPTDHYIDKDYTFAAHVMHAVSAIAHMPDKIALLGIVPNRPETGYGYILPADPLKISNNLFHVQAFAEKPSSRDTEDIIARGGLWNTLVMVFRISRMLELMRETAPDETLGLFELREAPQRVSEVYRGMRPWNFSTRFLARIPQHLIVLKLANVFWSDWGTRESIERTCRWLNLAPAWKPARATGERIGVYDAAAGLPMERQRRTGS